MAAGKVWLVGAGPGDAGLLTLRGREVMERADAIVFDRLVGDGVLAMMPERAEKINVGKEGGRHPVPQREIEKILVEKALEGKNVVRLKGGDPFVFGRGGEEIEALKKENIEFEVVPGVTSAIAAPSAAGIPVTHRGLAASLHIITAHTKDGGIADTDYGRVGAARHLRRADEGGHVARHSRRRRRARGDRAPAPHRRHARHADRNCEARGASLARDNNRRRRRGSRKRI